MRFQRRSNKNLNKIAKLNEEINKLTKGIANIIDAECEIIDESSVSCAACRNDKVANNCYAAYCAYDYSRRGGHTRKTYIQTGTSEMAVRKEKNGYKQHSK